MDRERYVIWYSGYILGVLICQKHYNADGKTYEEVLHIEEPKAKMQ